MENRLRRNSKTIDILLYIRCEGRWGGGVPEYFYNFYEHNIIYVMYFYNIKYRIPKETKQTILSFILYKYSAN